MIPFLFAAAITVQQVPLCEEVAHELNYAYIEGLISRDDAVRIIDRCFLMETSEN